MARPKCSRKDPKRLRSMGAMVRRVSTKMRAGRPALEDVWADSKRPNTELADQAKPAVDAVCRKRRRDDMDSQSPDHELFVRNWMFGLTLSQAALIYDF